MTDTELYIVYELIEYDDKKYDIRLERLTNKIIITNVYEYNTDNDITDNLTKVELSVLKKILEFELGLI